MEYTNETRRNWIFESDYEIDYMGIKSKQGYIQFPKEHYDNRDKLRFEKADDCLEWIGVNMDKFKKVNKTLYNVKFKGVTIDDSEWEKVQPFLLNPEMFKKEDIRIFDSWLAHNAKDRDKERFEQPVLGSFQKSIVGKNVFLGHPGGMFGSGEPPVGTWYDAKVIEVADAEMIDYLGYTPDKNLIEQLAKIKEIDGGLFWLYTKMYLLSDFEYIKRIDAGIIKFMSISFNAAGMREVQDKNGKLMWKEFINTDEREAEAYEGSFVFLGSQYGAGTKEPNQDDPQSAMKIPDKKNIENRKDENMEFTIKVFGQEVKVAEESDVVKLTSLIETKANELQAKADNMQAKIKETFGTDDFDSLKQIAADAKGYKDSLIADVLKWGTLCKVITDANMEEKKKFLASCDVVVLKQFADEYRAIHDDRNPPAAKTGEPEKKEIKKEVKLIY